MHTFATIQAKATAESWLEIPTHYLLCENDLTIPAFVQEMMTGMVKEKGGEIEVERIKSGHSPFLSQPDKVVEWLRRVAGEKI
jgi:pimeloyl-ACP methyl ester carboxylesterase